MRVLYLVLIFQVSAQLQCDKTIIRATDGGSFHVVCTYSTHQFRFSKKYWCLGESRSTCEILMDTERFIKASLRNRAQITDAVYRGLHVSMIRLQLRDTGVYWVGIDKIYADIMFKIRLEVTEEAVSRPEVWPVGSPSMTCQGQPLTLSCRSKKGTNVQYSWYREALPEAVLLQSTSDLPLHCAALTQDDQFVCFAQNTVSREHSKAVSIQILQPGHKDCIYSLVSDGFKNYDCRTTTLPPNTTTPLITTTMTPVNQTWMEILLRSWSGVPLWYDIIRWILFIAMMATTCLVHMYTWSRPSGYRVACKHHKHI